MHAEDYVYTPLPSETCIRLISFVPSSGRQPAISLSIWELHSAPPFGALSYTWGDPRCPHLDISAMPSESYLQAQHEIRCGGRRTLVRPNLLDAPKMLSAAANIQPQRFVWIDVLCIDHILIERGSCRRSPWPGALFSFAGATPCSGPTSPGRPSLLPSCHHAGCFCVRNRS